MRLHVHISVAQASAGHGHGAVNVVRLEGEGDNLAVVAQLALNNILSSIAGQLGIPNAIIVNGLAVNLESVAIVGAELNSNSLAKNNILVGADRKGLPAATGIDGNSADAQAAEGEGVVLIAEAHAVDVDSEANVALGEATISSALVTVDGNSKRRTIALAVELGVVDGDIDVTTNKELSELINTTVQEMLDDGSMDALLEKWGL